MKLAPITAALAVVALAVAHAQDLPTPPPADARVYDMAQMCPENEPFRRYYPERALRSLTNGRATVDCVLNADRRVTSCQIVDEEPRRTGFGEAAINLMCHSASAAYSRPVPEDSSWLYTDANGVHRVRAPINFNLEGGSRESPRAGVNGARR